MTDDLLHGITMLALAALVPACESGSLLPPLEASDGSTDAAMSSDATLDASTESGSPDASLTSDARGDAHGDATPDARSDGPGGGSGCAAKGLALCDDFERSTIDPAIWATDTNLGTVVLDSSRAHSGTRSVHVHVDSAGDARAFIVETSTFPAANDALYGRAFVFLNPPAPTVHATLFQALRSSPVADYSVGIQSGDIITNYYVENPFSEGTGGGTDAMPTGRWACFEWRFDGGMHTVNVWLDGAALSSATRTDWPTLRFERLELGLRIVAQDSTSPSGFDAWIDDVAVSSSRVGCF